MPIKPPPPCTSTDSNMPRPRGGRQSAAMDLYVGERDRRRCPAADLDVARQTVRTLRPLDGLSGEDAELVARTIAQCIATAREQALRLVSPDLDWAFEARLAQRHVRAPK